jgi:ribonuclease HI
MKRLKFDHHLAGLIRQGTKTTTWRLYDDKDISVNDAVELIDKVDPSNPATWVSIGIARVQSVVEKRLGDLHESDYVGHEAFTSPTQMIETYQRYYGLQVSAETPAKIVHFKLIKKGEVANVDDEYTTELKEVKLYADGGSRGNPGPSASGYVIMDMDDRMLVKKGVYLGVTTNNQAEYQALKLGLEEAQHMHVHHVHVYMDSLLVVNQMLGIFKVKNRDLWPIHQATSVLAGSFKSISYMHVPRAHNKLADGAVNEALDAAAQAQA